MIEKLAILDFDGTCTDVEEEGKGFVEALIATLAGITGRHRDAIRALYTASEDRLRAEADQHGWVVDGITVAPAIVDPYLRSKPIQEWILESCGLDPSEIAAHVDWLNGTGFKEHYAMSGTALRSELPEVLAALCNLPRTRVAIVTNSDAAKVEEKLRTIPNFDLSQVFLIGGAKKYIVGESPPLLTKRALETPEAMNLPGLNRPVQLRRPYYHARLWELRERYNLQHWDNVTVVGDIFELDLALPNRLGCRTVLVAGPNTPAYEHSYMLSSRRRCVATDLYGALGFITNNR